jgi:hypothetical protein
MATITLETESKPNIHGKNLIIHIEIGQSICVSNVPGIFL